MMTDRPIEPSDQERAALPSTTLNYLEYLEAAEAERDDLARELEAYREMQPRLDAPDGSNALRRQLEVRQYRVRAERAEAERDALQAKLAVAVEALESLARLGNGDRYGNSDGNIIARNALALIEKGQDHDPTL